jgi:hypothetical protein
LESATSGLEETREDFFAIAGVYPDQISNTAYQKIECGEIINSEFVAKTSFRYEDTETISKWNGTITMLPI